MNERWIWAAIAVGAGLLLGAAVAILIRRQLSRAHRRLAAQEIAKPLSTFVFWIVFAAGVLVAVAVSSPQHLETVPTELLAWLPRLAVAGLLLIGGYAVGLTIAAAVGRAVERVAGYRNRMLERAVRTVVLAGSLILALSQVGVDTTVVNLLIAGVVFATAAVLAGISVVGGRQVAAHVAAGRVLQRVIEVGMQIEVGDVAGVVAELRVAHVLVDTDDGRILVPYGILMDKPIRIPETVADPAKAD